MACTFEELAVSGPDRLVFGIAPRPVRCGFGLAIGGGLVFPEVNFTLPVMTISPATWSEVRAHYDEMARNILKRAVVLEVPGIVLEFELLPAMTDAPAWGAEITALLHEHLDRAHAKHGLKGALRVTPTDIRDQGSRPALRSGPAWEKLSKSFELCRDAGADILSIESIGGKEVHDPGLMYGDLRPIVFGLGVLAARDMAFLWDHISGTCAGASAAGHAVISGGDTACGFANTAMQLAHQKMLPEVLAAVVRAMSAARSLVAFEHGAVGPSKDCAYEGPILKAITGAPIAMEGKSATCAHFSPLGNIAAAVCDLWSNESVQNVRLLSGNAPEAYAELLAYDCRLMNVAAARGESARLRDWLTESDEWLSPQAAVLSPAAACRIARAIVSTPGDYARTVAAGREAVAILAEGVEQGRLRLSPRERPWLDRIRTELDELPATESEILAELTASHGHLFDPASYGLN
ncbi:methyltransferase MtaB domain-containing protein [Aquisphaera insulae]|uniref:methyltransferase MtaB domain-containing protein n=1 Tax=Aquisphaera insulae TaxID=2712864 RepID=UPI0013EAF521|nr:methyltransferase MtaB domain-containing protein [Aquisphaera insulae]